MELPFSIPVYVALFTGGVLGMLLLLRNHSFPAAGVKLSDATVSTVSTDSRNTTDNNKLQKPTASAETEDPTADPVYVYFGSQTGTAESFAEVIAKSIESNFNIIPVVEDLENFDSEIFSSHQWVILAVATYDEGDPTDSALAFYKWLSAKAAKGCLSKMKYAIMGLGNRQYEHFNGMARKTDKHMKRLGAQSICERGEGDDDKDIEADLAEWLKIFIPAFSNARHANIGSKNTAVSPLVEDDGDSSHRAKWRLSKKIPFDVDILPPLLPEELDDENRRLEAQLATRGYYGSKWVHVKDAYELRQQPQHLDGKSTYHLVLQIPEMCDLTYDTADTLDVYPENSPALVELWVDKLGLQGEGISLGHSLKFSERAGSNTTTKKDSVRKLPSLPPVATVKEWLYHICDLTALPAKTTLLEFCHFLEDDAARDALKLLLSDAHAHDWKTWVKDYGYTLYEFVEVFMASATWDIRGFVQLVSKQRARPYTISSSAKEDKHRLSVAVSLVKKQMPPLRASLDALKAMGFLPGLDDTTMERMGTNERVYKGICSTFLCRKEIRDVWLRVAIKASRFKIPPNPATSVVMVGAGAGVAPFRAFWQELYLEKQRVKRTAVLFFGCCNAEEDWIYKDEMLGAVNGDNAVLTELFCAFSRNQEQKIYVQHKIKEEAELVWQKLQDGAYLFICGGTLMGRDIIETLKHIAADHNAPSNYVEGLLQEHRIIEELWG